ncbi:MAG: aspartate dehydrogenase [Pseudomonadota bacterium]
MLTVGIAGLGAIGMRVARGLDRGEIEGMALTAVSAGNLDRAATRVSDFKMPPKIVVATELAAHADIVIECAPKPIFRSLAESALQAGRTFVPLSCGQMLEHMDLVDIARANGGRVLIPTGAIIGLDLIRAMAVGKIHSVTLETRKPPNGLEGAPHLVNNNISVENLSEPKLVFKGNAREAAIGFPANVNVAAALSLAGIGPDRTMVEVWADPTIDRNMQTVRVASDSGEAEMCVRNIPSVENPRTGKITALSVIACLQRMTAPMVAGT